MSGTDTGDAAFRYEGDEYEGGENAAGMLSAYALAMRCPSEPAERKEAVSRPICIRARYAMSGTDLAYGLDVVCDVRYGLMCLRAYYEMSGTS
eukprot:1282164-Rhodomonas_salina.2